MYSHMSGTRAFLKGILFHLTWLVLLILFQSDLFCQSLSFKNYTVNDGLPSSMIYAAVQDSKGYIWFATAMGVSRFDGYEFVNYTTSEGLPDNDVFNIFEDSHGRLWFLTSNGKVSYLYNDKIYNSENEPSLLPADSKSYISGITEDTVNNIIWMSTFKDGIVCYSSDKGVGRFFDSTSVERIHNVWCNGSLSLYVFRNTGVCEVRFDHNLKKIVSRRDIVRATPPFTPPPVGAMKSVQFSEEEIVYGNYFVAWQLNGKTRQLSLIWQNLPMHINNISKEEGAAWICLKKGVMRYSMREKSLSEPMLEEYNISSVLKDTEGNRWVTTLGDGVLFCPSTAIYRYTEKNGLLSNRVTCLSKDGQGKVWIGYEKGGISFLSKGNIQSRLISTVEGYDNVRVNEIVFSYKSTWVVTSYGLFALNKDKVEFLPSQARSMVEFPENNLWTASSYGILNIDRLFFEKNKRQLPLLNRYTEIVVHGLHDRYILRERAKKLFIDSRSNIWMSTENNLLVLEKDSLKNITEGSLKKTTYVTDFAEMPDGVVLLATNKEGLVAVKDYKKILSITKENGLSNDFCNAVDVNDGTIWVATNGGLNRIEGFPDDIRISLYNSNDGLLSNEVRDVLVVNDTVWVATHEGLNFFNKKDMQIRTMAPVMHIKGMSANGKRARPDAGGAIRLKHNENDIRIYFTGISYKSNREILYRYKLQEESPWIYTSGTTVELPELSPGDYHFVVASAGRYGEWSKEAGVNFVIRKPYWKTNAFLIGISVIVLSAVWATTATYFGYRRKQILQKYQLVASELKALRAQINPHFLFNALNSIHAVLMKKDIDAAQEYLHKFGSLMRSILDHSDVTQIAISEEIESLKNYLAIEELRMDHKFDYRIEVSPQIDAYNMEIPPMIIQPFVENAILHGLRHKQEKGHIEIRFCTEEDEDSIIITISDDGVGRKRSMELNGKRNHKSKGMKLITDRIDILNSQRTRKISLRTEDLRQDSNYPGTCVIIKIPTE